MKLNWQSLGLVICLAKSDVGCTLPETNIASKIGGRETSFLLGRPIFRGYVSFREGNWFF